MHCIILFYFYLIMIKNHGVMMTRYWAILWNCTAVFSTKESFSLGHILNSKKGRETLRPTDNKNLLLIQQMIDCEFC